MGYKTTKRQLKAIYRDPFRSIFTLGEAKQTAALADSAARMIAEHCDERIEKIRLILRKVLKHAIDGQNGSANYAMDRLAQIRKITEIALGK